MTAAKSLGRARPGWGIWTNEVFDHIMLAAHEIMLSPDHFRTNLATIGFGIDVVKRAQLQCAKRVPDDSQGEETQRERALCYEAPYVCAAGGKFQ